MKIIIKTPWQKLSLISTLLLALTGCMSTKTIPHGDMTMADIYKQKTGLSVPQNTPAVKAMPAAPVDLTNYTSTASDNINSQFKPLPNPSIAIFIFPHLAHLGHTDVPIPGYTTNFFLYESNHYAMPDELY